MKRMYSILMILAIALASLSTVGLSQTVWSEDWEGNWVVDWHVDNGTWEVGTPTSGPNSAYNGQNCAATVLAGNYSEPVDTRLIRHTQFVVPPASENPRFRFWYWFSFANGDWGEVQLKTSTGEWESISIVMNNYGSDAWSYGSVDISAYADSIVQIAFNFHSQRINSVSGDISTGWYIDDVSLITGPYVLNSPEDFELGFGDWSVDEGSWEVGIPTSGPSNAHSGQNCIGTNLEGNYQEPADSRLISPPFVVPSASENPAIQFWHWFSFANGDWGEIQISTDGSSWQAISNHFENTSSGAWTPFYISLLAYADSIVQIAFNFHSQRINSVSGDISTGWYIDDVMILPDIVPVELTSFTSILVNGDVMLEWSTATETNNQGFEIERRNENNEYQKISYVPGHGTTTEVQNYSYVDSKVASGKYFYRLKQIDFDGTIDYSNEVSVEVTSPIEYALEQNFPNPFNPSTLIKYQLPKQGFVTLKVYDVLGNEVVTVVNQEKPAGSYEANFNATNLSSGIYFYKLQAGTFVETKKMILLR